MTTQIAVRLPDDLVEFLDSAVAHGEAPSRAAIVAEALEQERRKYADTQILQEQGTEDDLDDLVAWTASSAVID
jgi:Arc/MetJ-type ribon-helix-helix transcriptional regulator